MTEQPQEEQALPVQAETAQIPAEEAISAEEEPTPPAQDHPLWAKTKACMHDAFAALDRFNCWMAPKPDSTADLDVSSPEYLVRRPILIGGWMFILIFGFLGLWSALAPLASAAIAPGKVILSGSKKTIQHLEGGVVDEIMVREGQTVLAGQPLIRLNETAARARLDLFRNQYQAALATEARLTAERDGAESITFPKALAEQDPTPATLREILISQERLFDSRRASINGQVKVLEQKKRQFDDEIAGLEAQIRAATEQINLLDEEIAAVRKLLKQGNAQKPRLLALQRQQAELTGDRGDYRARISRAQQAIAETELQMINLRNEFANQVATEMRETVDKIADLQERLKASNDVIDRIIIEAPLSGVVTALQAHTVGGVIRPGEPIMDIVPIDELVVEAQVSPQDIDVVRPGLEARVMLSAYTTRNVPPVDGEVIHVSPDRFEDERSGMPYFAARVRLDEEALAEYENIELTPGMPAEALIVTGSRSVLSYLMTPITDSFRKAFREQ
jgi:HlyD family type I secretion membrane fusion protein